MSIIYQLTNGKKAINEFAKKNISLFCVSGDIREQLQETLLEIYDDIEYVCSKNNIKVFLAYGTLLGAIRHQGFIPWDDDLDIAMTRADYKKFCTIFEKELSEKYILNAPNYYTNAINRFPKILKKGTILKEMFGTKNISSQKIFLDIFIIENVPDNRMIRIIKGIYVNFLEFIAAQVFLYENIDHEEKQFYRQTGKINYYIRMLAGRFFSYQKAARWFDMIDTVIQWPDELSKKCALPTGRKHYFGEILPREVFVPSSEQIEFEGRKANIYRDADLYLKNCYGDYMQIPPPEKREQHFVRKIEFGM